MTSNTNKVATNIVEVGTLLLILLWGYAAMSKILEFQKFTVQLSKSPMLNSFASFIAVAVPASELIIAVALINKKSRLLGLSASVFLLVLFTAYITAMLTFSRNIPCSCGGIIGMLGWKGHIVFNLVFIVIGVTAAYFEFTRKEANLNYNTLK